MPRSRDCYERPRPSRRSLHRNSLQVIRSACQKSALQQRQPATRGRHQVWLLLEMTTSRVTTKNRTQTDPTTIIRNHVTLSSDVLFHIYYVHVLSILITAFYQYPSQNSNPLFAYKLPSSPPQKPITLKKATSPSPSYHSETTAQG
jgi:hypothetical protein